MLVGRFEEVVDDVHCFLELLPEFLVLLVAPGVAQADELPVQRRDAVANLGVELFEVVGKTAQLEGVDNRLGHGVLAVPVRKAAIAIFLATLNPSKDKRRRFC